MPPLCDLALRDISGRAIRQHSPLQSLSLISLLGEPHSTDRKALQSVSACTQPQALLPQKSSVAQP